jgi:Tol biopolymer transport system component
MTAESPAQAKTLDSWKQIAAYLNRDVRTVRRWEKDRGLPVRRLPGTRPGVYALATEIDDWLKCGASRRAGKETAAQSAPASSVAQPRRIHRLVAAASVVAIALWIVWALPVAPKLSGIAEITHSGWRKGALLRRGAALYYQAKGNGMSDGIRRIDESGDQFLAALPPGPNVRLLDVSADGSTILFFWGNGDSKVWYMPLATKQPIQVGQAGATAAAWSTDGTRLAYTEGRSFYLANTDGTAPRRLLTLPSDKVTDLRWSPDGRRILFVLADSRNERTRLWEVKLDRGSAAPLLPGWSREETDNERGGQWTSDGRYFVFIANNHAVKGIWAIHQNSAVFGQWLVRPALLTDAAKADTVTPGPDGKKVFAVIDLPQRGELLRLDLKTRQLSLAPRWGWLSGGQLAFSPDGRRVAYLSYPEHMLWTADIDGKNPHPLAQGGALPQWSPDGRRVAFMKWKQVVNGLTQICIVSPDGLNAIEPVPLTDWQGAPSWISDHEIVFGDNGPTFPIPSTCALHVFDLKTGKAAALPGTKGLWTARPSPTGRYIAAQTNDKRTLMLYDRRTGGLTELFRSPEGTLGDNPTWSRDGAYIYMDVPYARNPSVYRIRIADRKVERIASLTGIQRVVEGIGLWMGLAPDDSLMILRQVDGSEIDSWDWVAP